MSRDEFRAHSDAVLTHVADRLHAVTVEFGPGDYPEDNGIACRNRMFCFAQTFLQVLDHYCFDALDDPWSKLNGAFVKESQPGVLTRLLSSSHFYIECYHFVRTQLARTSQARLIWPSQEIRKPLDWLTNVYEAAPETPMMWFRIAKSVDSQQAFNESANLYLEQCAAFQIGRAVDNNGCTWSGLSLLVDLTASTTDKNAWHRRCEEIFEAT